MSNLLPSERPARILITRTDRIGDLVLSTPVFRALRQKYPQAFLAGLTFCENHELIKDNPHLDEVILYDKKGSESGWLGNFIFAKKIRKYHFDCVIHLHGTNRMHVVTWLAGIPTRIGWNRRAKWTLTHPYDYVKKEGKKHEAAYNFDLLRDLDIEAPAELTPELKTDSRARQSYEELFKDQGISFDKPWIVINPSASNPSKTWPAERFAQVADRLAETYDAELLIIGTRKERNYADAMKEKMGLPVRDLTGLLSLGMLAAMLEDAALLISNDSGPVHVAQAVGTNVISIFVRTESGLSSTRWKPLRDNAVVLTNEVDAAGPNPKFTIDVEDVLAAVKQFEASFEREACSS